MRTWRFTSRLIEWRGPAPFVYAPLPADIAAELDRVKSQASYGWGVIPVRAWVAAGAEPPADHGQGAGDADDGGFETSLFPRDGTYLLPLKLAVRKRVGVTVGDTVAVAMRIGGRIREPDL